MFFSLSLLLSSPMNSLSSLAVMARQVGFRLFSAASPSTSCSNTFHITIS